MLRKRVSGLALLLIGPVSACAPALSSFTPAHVAPRHHVQAEAGLDVSIPTGTIGDLKEVGEALSSASEDRELSEAEQDELFRAGAAVMLNPPSVTPHIGVGFTLFDHFEIGGRYSTGALRLGARYQFLEQATDGVDLTAGLGGAHYSYEFPLGDVIPFLTLDDFTRWQLDLPLLVGRHGSWYRVWAGPRVLFGFYGTELTFEQPEVPGVTRAKTITASLDGVATYLGGQVGAAIGYKYVFVGVELTCAKLWNNATLKLPGRERDVDIDSSIIYPGFALMLEL